MFIDEMLLKVTSDVSLGRYTVWIVDYSEVDGLTLNRAQILVAALLVITLSSDLRRRTPEVGRCLTVWKAPFGGGSVILEKDSSITTLNLLAKCNPML